MTKRVPKVPSEPEGFGAWLRKLREAAGLTQREVAADAGMSTRQVMRWEDEGNHTAWSILRYLQAVGVKLEPAPPFSQARDESLARLEEAIVLLSRHLPEGSDAPREEE